MIRCLDQHCKDHELSDEITYYWICVSAEQWYTSLWSFFSICCPNEVFVLCAHLIFFHLHWFDITIFLVISGVLILLRVVYISMHLQYVCWFVCYLSFMYRHGAYANNQHKIADEMLTNPFLKAMSICKGTVSILDAGCVVYLRIWCIFELFTNHSMERCWHYHSMSRYSKLIVVKWQLLDDSE
jgi:hypothetical protein